jgi:hypothetical protein
MELPESDPGMREARRLPLILLLAAVLLPWAGGANALAATGGLIIYKQFSFDSDSEAEMAGFTSFAHFASVDNVVTTSGQTLRILPGQDPVYIPQPGYPGETAGQVIPNILAAERRFPQFASKLELTRRAWVAAPKAPVAFAANPVATPAPSPTPQAAPADEPSNVLHTRYGEVFHSWKVSSVQGDTVVISHADGISRISIADLPDNLAGFPPEVIARVQQIRLQQAAQLQKEANAVDAAHTAPPTPSPTPKPH